MYEPCWWPLRSLEPQTDSYVKYDLKFRISDLNFLCCHVSLASKCLHELDIFEDGKDNLEEFLTNIEMRKIKMSLLLFAKPWQSEEKNDLVKLLNQKQYKTLFYAAVPSANRQTETKYHPLTSQ